MDENKLKQIVEKIIDQKLGAMENLTVPQHYHNTWDASQLDPAVALLGFPVIQVADVTVAPTDTPANGTFRFYVDPTPDYRLWVYIVYQTTASVLTGSWRYVVLT